MNVLSLCSGIGGIDLAQETLGMKTVAFCENDAFCQKILRKHWKNTIIFDDVFTLNKTLLDNNNIPKIDMITAGFPCKTYQHLASKKGLFNEDGTITRSGLWFEILRIISEIKPKWVLCENVCGLLTHNKGRTIKTIIEGLESEGYKVLPVVSPACNYQASFEGKRLFIIAASACVGHRRCTSEECCIITRKLVANNIKGRTLWGETERCIMEAIQYQEALPDNLRSNYGFSDWLDRIKSLGNAVVPQQVYPILKIIKEINDKEKAM